jgi:hypothetical protein
MTAAAVDPRLRRKRRRDLSDLVGAPSIEPDEAQLSFTAKDAIMLQGGVSTQWLARAFRITRHMVEKKLKNCRPVDSGAMGNPLYDLVEAASYLVQPKLDIKQYLKTAKADELPEALRAAVWDSKLKKQRWEEKAAHLWRTEYVMDRMGEILQNTRQRVQQIPDKVERIAGLSIEQYKIVRNATDEVLMEIYDEIVEMQKGEKHFSQLHDEPVESDDA